MKKSLSLKGHNENRRKIENCFPVLGLSVLLLGACNPNPWELDFILVNTTNPVYGSGPQVVAIRDDVENLGPVRVAAIRAQFYRMLNRLYPSGRMTEAELQGFISRNNFRCSQESADYVCRVKLRTPGTYPAGFFELFPRAKISEMAITVQRVEDKYFTVTDFSIRLI